MAESRLARYTMMWVAYREPTSTVSALSDTPFFSMASTVFLCSRPVFSRAAESVLLALLLIAAPLLADDFSLRKGDRIAVVGNSLAERLQHDGWFETQLQAAHPDLELVVRHLGYSGDQVHYRPRAHSGFGDSDSHLAFVEATVVYAFFGYNESFADKPEEFKKQLGGWIDHLATLKYLRGKAPRLVLFSPIAHEDLKDPHLPDGSENNRRLAAITEATAEVAKEKKVPFVDLFTASQRWYAESQDPLTINGIHLNPKGNEALSRYFVGTVQKASTPLDATQIESLRSAVIEKDRHWFNRYRAASGNDIWGTRSVQDGNRATLTRELQMLDVLTANRDRQVWARAAGSDLKIDDSNLPEPLEVDTHITREVEYFDAAESARRLTLPGDLEVGVFASEDRFPEIVNPVALQVDTRGRLWVASWEDYPRWRPGTPVSDRLVILSDEDGDGSADQATTFAHVSQLTGFEFWNGGVIAVSAPDIFFLKDTDGDDVADVKIHLFSGIGADDTHHAANNLILGPDGYIYYQRGIFILENVETPWRVSEESGTTGLYRFNPRTFDYSFVVENAPNPHGISFDRWGNLFITDGTSGKAFHVYHASKAPEGVDPATFQESFQKRPLVPTTVRPVASSLVLSSEHFPPAYQNDFLILNTIGYQGIKRYQLAYHEGGVVDGVEAENFLFTGSDPTFKPNSEATPRVLAPDYTGDPNFRPTDAVVGFDGALYFSDWQNAVITHSPYNLRDSSRDREHGRIFRVTAKGRPLQKKVSVHGESIDHLLGLLRHPTDSVRHQVRVELSARPSKEVIAQTKAWAATLDEKKAEDAIPLLEALWLHQQHGAEDQALLQRALGITVPEALPAVRQVEWHWSGRNTHFVGGSGDTTSARMQHRTFFEPYWVKLTGIDTTPKVAAAITKVDLTDQATARLTIQAALLRYTVDEFTVKVGQPVELTLDNTDLMPHNLLITAPGALEAVSQKALAMGVEGWGKHYIPENTPEILHATRLVDAAKQETLRFKAPDQVGDYPYVCTFPGHSYVMRGVMKVVK